MTLNPRIVLSNATRLHAHQMAVGLSRAGFLERFITSLWYKPNCFPYTLLKYAPQVIQQSAISFLKRRYIDGLDAELVEQRWCIELQRLVANGVTRGKYNDRLLFWHKEKHDAAVAQRLKKLRPDIFIGYEISCRDSMREAKSQGAITIMDLAGFHYRYTHRLQEEFEPGIDKVLLQRLADRKDAELKAADYIFCLSTLARDSLTNNGIPEDRIRLINLGADSGVFRFAEKPRTGKFTLLFVGALGRHKGVHVLLEAFKRANLANAELVLVGPRFDDALLQQYVGLFTHHKYMQHEELARQYQQANVFVLPSFLDSWGMVVNEAMACGTPVIVSRNVGSRDLVNESNGFTFTAGDVDDLMRHIQYCYLNRETLAEMGKQARQAVAKLTWDAYHSAVTRTIYEIWKSRKRQAA